VSATTTLATTSIAAPGATITYDVRAGDPDTFAATLREVLAAR
jgi:hypothetical protein